MINKDKYLIQKLFETENWNLFLSSNITPKDIVSLFDFKESMHLIPSLLMAQWEDDTLKSYAIRLMRTCRTHFNKEWDVDWKNDAYLGICCKYLSMWDEAYKTLKRAYDRS